MYRSATIHVSQTDRQTAPYSKSEIVSTVGQKTHHLTFKLMCLFLAYKHQIKANFKCDSSQKSALWQSHLIWKLCST